MKTYLILTGMLLIGATSFSQPTRRAESTRENKNENARSATQENPSRTSKTEGVKQQEPTSSGTRTQSPSGSVNTPRTSNPDVSRDNSVRTQSPPSDVPRSGNGNTTKASPSDSRRTSGESQQPNSPRKSGTQSTQTNGRTNNSRSTQTSSSTHDARYNNNQNAGVNRNNYGNETRYDRTIYRATPAPRPVEYRRVTYPYRAPVSLNIVWTNNMYVEYRNFYPYHTRWDYRYGSQIKSVSAYDAYYMIGEVANVYGQVHEVYYSSETDEYVLYFGPYYPYHDFSVIMPGFEARKFSRRPNRFFERRNIAITGLVSEFEGKPEILVRRNTQISLY